MITGPCRKEGREIHRCGFCKHRLHGCKEYEYVQLFITGRIMVYSKGFYSCINECKVLGCEKITKDGNMFCREHQEVWEDEIRAGEEGAYDAPNPLEDIYGVYS
jgi:hypothetical protein